MRAMTGLNHKVVDALLPSFAQAYEQSRLKPDVQRQRAMEEGEKQRYAPAVKNCFTSCCTANAIPPLSC